MTSDILRGEACRGCGRDLSRSFLTKITLGIEKGDALLYPVLCVCGAITVIGAGSFISHLDDLCHGGSGHQGFGRVRGQTSTTQQSCRSGCQVSIA